jgi:hypothetical protein
MAAARHMQCAVVAGNAETAGRQIRSERATTVIPVRRHADVRVSCFTQSRRCAAGTTSAAAGPITKCCVRAHNTCCQSWSKPCCCCISRPALLLVGRQWMLHTRAAAASWPCCAGSRGLLGAQLRESYSCCSCCMLSSSASEPPASILRECQAPSSSRCSEVSVRGGYCSGACVISDTGGFSCAAMGLIRLLTLPLPYLRTAQQQQMSFCCTQSTPSASRSCLVCQTHPTDPHSPLNNSSGPRDQLVGLMVASLWIVGGLVVGNVY